MNTIKNILERLNEEFPPKSECSNALFYTELSNCKIGLHLWINQNEFRSFYLDDKAELDDLDKLVNDIKNLIKEE